MRNPARTVFPGFLNRKTYAASIAQIFTISIGDVLEIHSGNFAKPFVGKLLLLDRGSRQFKVSFVSRFVFSQRVSGDLNYRRSDR